MKLKYLAHAAFLITSNEGTTVMTDPYEPGGFGGAINYGPIDETTEVITVSHDHADHAYIAPSNEQAVVIRGAGKHVYADIQMEGFQTYHDENEGRERGGNMIFVIKTDAVSILHLGDLGHELNKDTLDKLRPVDILLIPVGGIFTIDAQIANQIRLAINPKICIPMHYKTDKLAFNLDSVDPFIKLSDEVKNIGHSEIEISRATLPKESEVWVLNMDKSNSFTS